MKYIDRIRMGIEMYMDHLSPMTSSIHQHSPEDAAKLMMSELYNDQHEECRRIHEGLQRLLEPRFQLSELLTQRVCAVAKSPYTPTPDRLVPVFRWVQALREGNRLARERWLVALKDCCSDFAPEAGQFLRSFAEISAQRVSLVPEDGGLTLSLPESLWGRVTLRFTGIAPEELPATALFGYLFWVEGDRLPDGSQFRFLLDTSFSDTDYQDRLLEPDHWMEFSFTCTHVSSELVLRDYAARTAYHGFSGFNAMILCFGELLRKYYTLGPQFLNGPELRLVPIASLFYRMELVPNACTLNDHLPLMTQLLENRYQLMQMVAFLNRECGAPGEQLAKLLEGASDDYAAEDSYACRMKLEDARSRIPRMLAAGELRPLIQPVWAMLREATAPYHGDFPFAEAAADVERRITAELLPILHLAGFTGAFPNYCRVRSGFAEYLSFLTDFMPAATPSGALLFHCSIAVTRCLTDGSADAPTVFGQPPEQFGASDFVELRIPGCSSGRVCSMLQDGIRCAFPFRLGTDPAQESQRDSAIRTLTSGVHIALLALDHRPLPRDYHPHPKTDPRRRPVFWDLFNDTLLWALPLVALILFLCRDRLTDLPAMILITLLALAAGAVAALGLTTLRWFRYCRRIWHR